MNAFIFSVFIFFGWIMRSRIAGSYGSATFNFWKNLCTVLSSHQHCVNISFSIHPHQHLISCSFDSVLSDECDEIICPYHAFPWWVVMLSIFPCACWTSLYFGKMSIQIHSPFFNWTILPLSCMSSLYILDINPLSNV